MPNTDPTHLAARLCSVLTVESHRDRRHYDLVPVAMLVPTTQLARTIATICNQPLIYATLFADVLGGRPYAEGDALQFFAWASHGWEAATHFVYVLLDEAESVVGALDIKSASLESAEIGYWLSEEHSGVMANAVEALAALARDAGIRGLHALVRPGNERSARVLLRAGFTPAGPVQRKGRVYDRYDRSLGGRSGPALDDRVTSS